MTTREDLRAMLARDPEPGRKPTHMLVVCDTFSYEDYPVHVFPGEDVEERIRHYSTNMQRVMEVYNYSLPLEPQLAADRVWNVEPKEATDGAQAPPEAQA